MILTGHSLGGTRALLSSYHTCFLASNSVNAVHVFNAGAGLGADPSQQEKVDDLWRDPNKVKALVQSSWFGFTEAARDSCDLAATMFQEGDGQPECTRTCHHIFGDVISMMNVSKSHMEVITYQVHAEAPDRHSVANFTV